MTFDRRRFLAASLAACAAPLFAQQAPALLPAAKGRRVVIVGGGWGGLSAARQLRALAPELEVVLLETNPSFFAMPLSNKWLAGLRRRKAPRRTTIRAAAKAYGYTFLQAEVDGHRPRQAARAHRRGALDYDWLVLASAFATTTPPGSATIAAPSRMHAHALRLRLDAGRRVPRPQGQAGHLQGRRSGHDGAAAALSLPACRL